MFLSLFSEWQHPPGTMLPCLTLHRNMILYVYMIIFIIEVKVGIFCLNRLQLSSFVRVGTLSATIDYLCTVVQTCKPKIGFCFIQLCIIKYR